MKKLLQPLCVLMLLYVNTMAQPAFPAGNEIHLFNAVVDLYLNTTRHETFPCIAVHDDGSVLLTWPGGMQRFTPDLQPAGAMQTIRRHELASPYLDGRWAVVEDSNHHISETYSSDHFFRVYDSNNRLFRSATFAQDHRYSSFIYDDIDCVTTISLDGHSTSKETYFVCMQASWLDFCGVQNARISSSLKLWHHETNALITPNSDEVLVDLNNPMSVLPSASVSDMVGGCFALCKHDVVRIPAEGRYILSRYFALYDLHGNTVSPKQVIDTLSESEADYSERVTLGGSRDIFILRLNPTKKEVMTEHIAQSGQLIERTYPGIHNIRLHKRDLGYWIFPTQIDMDLEIARLSDGRYIAVWSAYAEDSTTDVYTALFDSVMTMVGSPKRLNAEVAGYQFEPQINIRNDVAYVVWLTIPDGHERMSDANPISPVSLRSYTVDNILGAENAPAVASPAPALYPAPVHDRLTCVFDDRSHIIGNVEILDVLGRVVRSTPLTGSVINLSVGDLRAGVYFLRVPGRERGVISKFVKVNE